MKAEEEARAYLLRRERLGRSREYDSALYSSGAHLQNLTRDFALQEALRILTSSFDFQLKSSTVLDIGSGAGTTLLPIMGLDILDPGRLHAVDVLQERIERGKGRLPGVSFHCGDATRLEFPDDSFDFTMQCFLFHALSGEEACRIGSEMVRVTRKGGFILSADWSVGSESRRYQAVNTKLLDKALHAGLKTERIFRLRGQLAPPIGRLMARFGPTAYFLIWAMFPWLRLAHYHVYRRI